jgi:hypothetical protein
VDEGNREVRTSRSSVTLYHLQHFIFFQHLNNWPKHLPICCHAEGQTTAAILLLAELCDRPIHICHVARQSEVSPYNILFLFCFLYTDCYCSLLYCLSSLSTCSVTCTVVFACIFCMGSPYWTSR